MTETYKNIKVIFPPIIEKIYILQENTQNIRNSEKYLMKIEKK